MFKERRKYEKEFKLMAVELVKSGKSTKEVAEDLGIKRDLICRWRRELEGSPLACFSGNGNANLNLPLKKWTQILVSSKYFIKNLLFRLSLTLIL